jgi:predicted nuclease of predicted toxin-antitoxin system
MLRFVIDAQLPPGLVKLFSEQGWFAEHVNRINLGVASDSDIWAYVKAKGAVLVIKDADFVHLARLEKSGPQVVWIRLGNVTNRALQARIRPVLPELVAALEAGERVVEII